MYKKAVRITDLIPPARGDVNCPAFGCPSTLVTVQSRLERRPAGQGRTEQQLWCPQEIQSPIYHSQGDPRLHWSNEDGSSGFWSETGTQTPLAGVWKSLIQEVCKELGLVGVPPQLSHGGYSGHLVFQYPISDKKITLIRAQSASWWSL